MFIDNEERNGTGYFEFQFCKNSFVETFSTRKYWKSDSIYIYEDDFEKNADFFHNIFKKLNYDFDFFGINYFDKKTSKELLEIINEIKNSDLDKLKSFLKVAIEKYNGFYLIGI